MMRAHDIANRAAELVGGDRAKTHGSKLENHANIARLWTAYGRNAGWLTGDLSALDVANLMELLKVARRQAGAHNPDDYVDGAGYASVAGEIAETLEMQRAAVAASARVDDGADAPGEGLVAEKAPAWRVRDLITGQWVHGHGRFDMLVTTDPALAWRGSRAEAQNAVAGRAWLVAEPVPAADKPEEWVVRSTANGTWRSARPVRHGVYTSRPALARRMSRAEAQRIASEHDFLVAEPASTLPAAKSAEA